MTKSTEPTFEKYPPLLLRLFHLFVMAQRRQRQNNSSNELTHDYVLRLESRISYLEKHHRKCNLNPSLPISLQSPPESPNDSDGESENGTKSFSIKKSHPTRPTNEPTIGFIHYELPMAEKVVQRPLRHRWMHEADILLKEIPEATTWVEKWEKRGLSHKFHYHNAVGTVLGTPPTAESRFDAMSSATAILDNHDCNVRENLLASVSRYAETVKSSGAAVREAAHIAAFQELVFVSLCVILLDHGVETAMVDEIMRICVSDSSERNLRRLRLGALWVNKVIHELQWAGWGERASGIFILCKVSLNLNLSVTED